MKAAIHSASLAGELTFAAGSTLSSTAEQVRAGARNIVAEASRWQPGRPVITAPDHAAWQAWRRERILQQQRERRASLPTRVDYYPSEKAAAIIRRLRGPRAGQDNSSIINAALELYEQQRTRNSGI